MYIVNLAEPLAMLIALLINLVFIILGRKLKNSVLPAIALFIFLILLVVYTIQTSIVTDEYYKSIIHISISFDCIMVFLSYISYLWVDDIEAKEKNKKSIDNSLDWFWKKIG